MRRLNQRVAALAAAMLLPLAAQAPMAQSLRPAVAAEDLKARVIVQYRADSDMTRKQAMTASGRRILQAQALGQRIGVALTTGSGISERAHVLTARGLSSAALASRLAAQPDVEFAVVDERRHLVAVPLDPLYLSRPTSAISGGPAVGQWYLKPPGPDLTPNGTGPAAINAETAWDITIGNPLSGNARIVVAVLDTGLRDHPDLQGGNVVAGYDMVAADSDGSFVTANDGNGRDADPSDPGDWVTQAEINASGSNGPLTGCEPSGSSWHGTQTLGLIGAATSNNIGVASVGRNVAVQPIRVLGKCGGYDSDILVGMQWAAGVYSATELAGLGLPANATPAKVLNMSLGSSGACSAAYQSAMTRLTAAGVVVVASAGNTAGHAVSTPANCPGFIAVGGLRHLGTKVGFSDLGPEIAISAPGGNCVNIDVTQPCLYPIMTTSNSGSTVPLASIYTDSFEAPSLGTSFAAPLVAGTAALMLSVKPSSTPAEVRSVLQSTARSFPTGGGSADTKACTAPTGVDQLECYCTTSTCGAGMLNAHAAVAMSASGVSAQDLNNALIGVQARILVTTAAPTAGQPVTVSSPALGVGQSATYAWAIASSGGTGATVTVSRLFALVIVAPVLPEETIAQA